MVIGGYQPLKFFCDKKLCPGKFAWLWAVTSSLVWSKLSIAIPAIAMWVQYTTPLVLIVSMVACPYMVVLLWKHLDSVGSITHHLIFIHNQYDHDHRNGWWGIVHALLVHAEPLNKGPANYFLPNAVSIGMGWSNVSVVEPISRNMVGAQSVADIVHCKNGNQDVGQLVSRKQFTGTVTPNLECIQ